MSEIDLSPLQLLLSEYSPFGRTRLLPALQAAQNLYGYIPEPAAAEIGRALGAPLAEVHGVIEFYSMLYTQPVGQTIARVCTSPACGLRGADALLQALGEEAGLQPGETSADGLRRLERAPCLGLCEHAPAVLVNETPIAPAAPEAAAAIWLGQGPRPYPLVEGELRILTGGCCRPQPAMLDDYVEAGGYTGLRMALRMKPLEVIELIKASGLVGRGGAAFPTGIKWEAAARVAGPEKYAVCNADESEPGTFKDRALLEMEPHRAIEGLMISAYAVGARKGFFYIRGEYPFVYQNVEAAVQEAHRGGYLGENILGSGFDFDIEMRLGAGAYICGEETALFESIEGKRGLPRLKPPFPTTHGLFGKPTVINNVETLFNVPFIVENGPAEYRRYGTEKSPGPKLFCVAGDVARPGLYEVEFGITLRHLLYDLAGGFSDGRKFKAMLLGGAAGVFAGPQHLDTPLSFEGLRDAGLLLGSGVITVFDDRRDLRDVLRRVGRFFAHESCGKCYPCQIGTQRQLEILERAADGHPLTGDRERLLDLTHTMTDASICGLGQTAGLAAASAVRQWPEMFG
jgi:NADH-quinone oxidoreductase subunit F